MSRPPVTIIITSHSNKDQLALCLEYAYATQYNGPRQLIVVDNGSTDNSVFLVTSRYPQVKVISNDVNLGIGAALNQAVRASQAPYIATLHQDVEIRVDWLETMVSALENDPKIGSAGSLIKYRSAKGTRLEVDSYGIRFLAGRPVRLGQGDNPEDTKFQNVRKAYGVSGAAAMYKKEMLENIKIGQEYFDESLFSEYEDYDIAFRANLSGYMSVCVPGSPVLHKRGILWESNLQESKEREIVRASGIALLMTKCLPMNLFKKYKKQIRKDMRSRFFGLAKNYPLEAIIRAWNFYRSSRKDMIRKQIKIYENMDFNAKALEWEIFGRN